MKKSLSLALMLVCVFAAATAQVTAKYEKSEKRTIVETKLHWASQERPAIYLKSSYSGKELLESPQIIVFYITVNISSLDPSKHFFDCETVIMIDGQPYDVGRAANYKDEVLLGGMIYTLENLVYTMPFNKIEEISAAGKVDVKICEVEFSLSPNELRDIKEFVRLLTPVK